MEEIGTCPAIITWIFWEFDGEGERESESVCKAEVSRSQHIFFFFTNYHSCQIASFAVAITLDACKRVDSTKEETGKQEGKEETF